MHEIIGSTAVNGHFVDGSSTHGGTVVAADWLNTVQDEICNLITSVGIPLNSDGNDDKKQLIAAINKICSNLSSTLSEKINLKLSIDDFNNTLKSLINQTDFQAALSLKLSISDFNNTLKTLVNKTDFQLALDDIAWCKVQINKIIGKVGAV